MKYIVVGNISCQANLKNQNNSQHETHSHLHQTLWLTDRNGAKLKLPGLEQEYCGIEDEVVYIKSGYGTIEIDPKNKSISLNGEVQQKPDNLFPMIEAFYNAERSPGGLEPMNDAQSQSAAPGKGSAQQNAPQAAEAGGASQGPPIPTKGFDSDSGPKQQYQPIQKHPAPQNKATVPPPSEHQKRIASIVAQMENEENAAAAPGGGNNAVPHKQKQTSGKGK